MELTEEFKNRFVKNLQGKDFILYGGLLELVKARGLKKINTHVVQIPSKENNMYAVMEAEVQTEDGIFKEIGDASPESVTRTIQPHILRMASTRAKARAMRDAVGIDLVAVEELGKQDLAEEEFPPNEIVITFGKYAEKRLGDVLKDDPEYVKWLRDNARDSIIRDSARALLSKGQH